MGDTPTLARLPASMAQARAACEAHARAHAAGGGRVCGYLTPYAPIELISAAGFLPMALGADANAPTPRADEHMEGLFDRSIRGVFERLLSGDFSYLSAIVLPRANDSAHRLYYYLCELARVGAADLQVVLLFDLSLTADNASRRYSLAKAQALRDDLGALGSGAIADKTLSAAIGETAKTRALLESMIAKRRAAPGAIPGETALAAFATARMAPPAEFAALMETLLANSTQAPSAAPRIAVCGNAPTDESLHTLIQSAGGVIVGDMHAGGDLSLSPPIAISADPLTAMVEAYRAMPGGSRTLGDAASMASNFMKQCAADAAIFRYTPEEEALTWDFPAQQRRLESEGVRVLRLSSNAHELQPADRDAVSAFLASLAQETPA